MYPCCNEFACHVLCVGSGKWEASTYYEAAWGANNKKGENEYWWWIMDTRYLVLYKKLRHAWCSATCAPCAICVALLRGAYWHGVCCDVYFVQMRCYTMLYTFPWHNENACVHIPPADAYMPTATRIPLLSISSLQSVSYHELLILLHFSTHSYTSTKHW